jgi:hypothetical protein
MAFKETIAIYCDNRKKRKLHGKGKEQEGFLPLHQAVNTVTAL